MILLAFILLSLRRRVAGENAGMSGITAYSLTKMWTRASPRECTYTRSVYTTSASRTNRTRDGAAPERHKRCPQRNLYFFFFFFFKSERENQDKRVGRPDKEKGSALCRAITGRLRGKKKAKAGIVVFYLRLAVDSHLRVYRRCARDCLQNGIEAIEEDLNAMRGGKIF